MPVQKERAEITEEKRLFAQRLRDLLRKAGISQKDFALEIGAHATIVSRWVRGEFMPSGEYLAAIGERFKVSLDYLLLGKIPSRDQALLMDVRAHAATSEYILKQALSMQEEMESRHGVRMDIAPIINSVYEQLPIRDANVQYHMLPHVTDKMIGDDGALHANPDITIPYAFRSPVLEGMTADPQSCIAVTQTDDAMAPIIRRQDTVVINCTDVHIRDNAIMAIIRNKTILIRRTFVGSNGNILFRACNKDYPDIVLTEHESINPLGRCIWKGGFIS